MADGRKPGSGGNGGVSLVRESVSVGEQVNTWSSIIAEGMAASSRKKPLALVIGITGRWAFAAGTVLLGLREHSPRLDYDLIIYHDGLSDKQKQLLRHIRPCVLVEYDTQLIKTDRVYRVTKMAFSRYECFSMLGDYEKVAWLDADILIRGDISPMVDGIESGIAMYKYDGIPASVSFSSPVPGYDLSRNCYASGTLTLSDHLAACETLKKWCYEKTSQWAEQINSDQAILNLLVQEFDLTVTELDMRYCCPPHLELTDTIIVHPWGRKKFWNGHVHPLWDKYYFQWQAMGGDGPAIQRGPFGRLIPLRVAHHELTLRSGLYRRVAKRLSSALVRLRRLLG